MSFKINRLPKNGFKSNKLPWEGFRKQYHNENVNVFLYTKKNVKFEYKKQYQL